MVRSSNSSIASGGGGPTSVPGGVNTASREEALRRMAKLVSSLMARNDCGPFREPVDWRGLELWDYPKIIKKVRVRVQVLSC